MQAKNFLYGVLLLAVAGTLWFWFLNVRDQRNSDDFNTMNTENEMRIVTIRLGGAEITAEAAETQEQRIQGLSDRESLPQDRGLLFVYETPGNYGIVMRRMHFPIDILWFDEEKRVVGITERAQPESYPGGIFYPDSPAIYILEVNAGFAERYGIQLGDRAEWGFFR